MNSHGKCVANLCGKATLQFYCHSKFSYKFEKIEILLQVFSDDEYLEQQFNKKNLCLFILHIYAC